MVHITSIFMNKNLCAVHISVKQFLWRRAYIRSNIYGNTYIVVQYTHCIRNLCNFFLQSSLLCGIFLFFFSDVLPKINIAAKRCRLVTMGRLMNFYEFNSSMWGLWKFFVCFDADGKVRQYRHMIKVNARPLFFFYVLLVLWTYSSAYPKVLQSFRLSIVSAEYRELSKWIVICVKD